MDNTVVTDGGLNLSRGQQARINLARAIYRESDIYLLDDPLAGLDVRVQEAIISNCLKNFLKNKIVIFVTNNLDHLKYAKEIIIIDRGEVKIKSATDEVPVGIITKTNCLEENHVHNNDVSLHEISRNIYHEEKQMGHVDFTHYVKYIKFGGGVVMFTFIFGIFVSAQFTESYSEKLLSKWVDHQHDSLNNSSTNTTVLIDEEKKTAQSVFNLYMIMIGLSTGLDLIKACAFLTYCRNASIKFHKTLCRSIINCVITFLDNHFIGNILNRFSYDLDLIDELFPFLFMEIIKNSLAVAGVLVLVISVNKIFLFISIFMIVLLVLLRTFYIPAARALTRLSALILWGTLFLHVGLNRSRPTNPCSKAGGNPLTTLRTLTVQDPRGHPKGIFQGNLLLRATQLAESRSQRSRVRRYSDCSTKDLLQKKGKAKTLLEKGR
ncbi:probable multidrug resistance-associated protein lethal(2)03659, partial [Sitophilus oryzae]|uniref:Probable multidrug resistance-associated protein lethal(2)03659 n=1 Tax=Sitophilus oryzae TaxID=7048 RepID=A0A6J2YCI0_SITOR